MRIKKSLALNSNNKTMTYMDKWSSKFTWGGDEKNKPTEGDMAVLTEGKLPVLLHLKYRLHIVYSEY